ncbi:hypothetical protein [Streptomyces cadmiisoli]|uniref:hypothetical protein n=1 Tax=Streptomyces cadmiisoli TaxID=2184053 RepID=UPI0013A6A9AF|nr:hypothetical protein [Streptomyces cadmiisoli]
MTGLTVAVTGALRASGSGRLLGLGLPFCGQEVGEVFEFGQEAGSGELPVGDDQRRVRIHALTVDIAATGTATGGQVSGVSGVVADLTAVRLAGLRLRSRISTEHDRLIFAGQAWSSSE